MNFLSTPQEIEGTLKRLLRKCDHVRWAVAWASHGTSLFDLLKENEEKIRQLTVGIHFYQTHPYFIATFLNHESVNFVMHPNGVFHPKLYFFESGSGGWDCVTGSPNFTHGAFTGNAEVAVHFSHKDAESSSIRDKIVSTLDDYFSQAKRLTTGDLDAYRSIWNPPSCIQTPRLLRVSRQQESPEALQGFRDFAES